LLVSNKGLTTTPFSAIIKTENRRGENNMKYIALAKNIKTGEVVELERYNTAESAWWDIGHNVEWDEDDVREDWVFDVVEAKN
jgi:hypothetical protein